MGLYVYGSLATGDFELDVSDIDLIAVLRDRPDEVLVRQLGEMHEGLARAEPEWKDRIEVDYVSVRGLAHRRTHATTIVRISPGEPLHMIEAGRDYLLDWYPARQDGIDLEGPRLDSLVPPIPEVEYLEEVRKYLAGFRDRFDDDASPGSQAYAILTMCRGLAALRFGDRLSKREAAARTQREFPRWSGRSIGNFGGEGSSGVSTDPKAPRRWLRLARSSRTWTSCSSDPRGENLERSRCRERVTGRSWAPPPTSCRSAPRSPRSGERPLAAADAICTRTPRRRSSAKDGTMRGS